MKAPKLWLFIAGGLVLSLALAAFLAPWASRDPDGLEHVAGETGFVDKAQEHPFAAAPMPDYVVPGVKNEKVSTALAGVAGTLAVFIIAGALAMALRKRRTANESP